MMRDQPPKYFFPRTATACLHHWFFFTLFTLLLPLRLGEHTEKKRKFRIGGKHDEDHHDDHAEHTWHDHHPGAFHRMSKRHSESIRRRMSSVSGVAVPEPEDISTHAPIVINNNNNNNNNNKKAELRQRWPHDALNIRVSWKISESPDYAHGYFSRNL